MEDLSKKPQQSYFKTGFSPVSPQVSFPALEEEILKFWKENNIFEKSVNDHPETKNWTFLDGPPFITGNPHYGTLLSSIPKDVFPRFKTMQGYRVRRVWGWDCHGLPAENKVEVKLGLKSKREIEEKIGVKKFIEECKLYVSEVSKEWEWYIDHIGRWVDLKHAYRTMDRDYMESVMWVFSQMYKKNYVYKGLRVSLYCPHCGTPISNFEVAMDTDNYKELEDSGTTYKYKLENEDKTFILAWSTTPWNKIVTPALAVNPKLTYIKVLQNGEKYILAKSTLEQLKKEDHYEVLSEMQGEELVGKKFVPHYDYYSIEPGKKAFEIIGGDFVTADEGTGVVTIAAYGEEDLEAMKQNNIHIQIHLDDEGTVKPEVPLFGGMYYLKANKAVNEDLATRGLIYKDEKYMHKVPLCWRCHTRLYYSPQDAWYVDVKTLKSQMISSNELVNWFPSHFKNGRFLKSLENAPDWNISRSRYWGSPVPVWECDCGERFVPSSIAELEEASGQKISDLHKPEIDEVLVNCESCGKKAKRVPEVLDSWIEAGSASFGERHYPFADKDVSVESFYPPDFIGEYTGQIRAWFYVLHVIANALALRPDGENFLARNVLVEGVILGTDGRKMSKNYGNYPDPKELLEKYGGDALRLYLLGSPVMHGEDVIISEEQYRQQVRGMLLVLWNVYNFFLTYANVDKWYPNSKTNNIDSENVLDKWILSLLNKLIKDVTASLEEFDTVAAIASIQTFVTEFSTWYLRRSRDRVGPTTDDPEDRRAFYETTHFVLVALAKIMAPIAPFFAEAIYKNLTDEESVHLAIWPEFSEKSIDNQLEDQMLQARKIVEIAHAKRKMEGVKLRQPLALLTVTAPLEFSAQVKKIIADEVNVKSVRSEKGELAAELDFKTTDELIFEGQARDIVRKLQEERKKLGTAMDEKVNVTLVDWPVSQEEYIKRHALVNSLVKGEELSVAKT